MTGSRTIATRPVENRSIKRLPSWLAPAAAGIFAGVGLFDLLPAASAALGIGALAWAAGGAALMLASVKAAVSTGRRWVGWAAGLGIWLHSLVEGIAAATGFGAGMGAGVVTSIALVAHVIPETAALFAFLIGSGVSIRRAAVASAIPWGLVVVGFAVSRALLTGPNMTVVGAAMGLGAGAFVSLACLIVLRRCGPALRKLAICSLAVVWVALQHLV